MTAPGHLRPKGAVQHPFQRFFQAESAGGALLLLCAIVAMAVANSPWSDAYHRFWNLELALQAGSHDLRLTLHAWINDGLMAVFFLLVGLEIKRELLAGELSSPRQAALPIAGALGGMIVPATIFAALTVGTPAVRGWGIPMATDIAFALGTLALAAPHLPTGAKVFLTALAIVDDMGAVLIIALFYTAHVEWQALGSAAAVYAVLIALNRAAIRQLTPYVVLGAVLWLFVHESGIHATVAGVLLAFTVPARSRIDAAEFSARARTLIDEFDRTETGDLLVLTSKGQQEALFALERTSEAVTEPLLRLEHALHGFAAFIVMPLFALANAGVSLSGPFGDPGLSLAAGLGLALGKPAGIMLAVWLAIAGGVAALPHRVTWAMLHACAWLGAIGFTMSLFIATLAFDAAASLDAAKIGVMAGSLCAGIVAVVLLRRAGSRVEAASEPGGV